MTIIYVLIPLGLVLVIAATAAFFWATRAGQFDDLETPAVRILLDDDRSPPAASAEEARRANKADDDDQPVG